MTIEARNQLMQVAPEKRIQAHSVISEHGRYEVERTRRTNYGEVPIIEDRYGVDVYQRRANMAVMRVIRMAEAEPELMKMLVEDLVGKVE